MAPKSKAYEQFGPYILFKKLETDTLGDLWRAGRIDGPSLGPAVALRRITGGNREALLGSIATARQVAPLLTGPSFVRDQHIDAIGGIPFVAHDYSGGRSLRHIVDRARGASGVSPNPIPLDQAILIAEKVALSLATIAELRFAGERLSHGSLLPQFVWITDEGEVRVAGQQLGKGLINGKTSSDLARYFSPEYQHSGQPTKTSEVYSLGTILFLAITGHEPPDPMSTSAFAAAIRGAKTMTGSAIPDDIKPILDKSLNLDPSMRFASAFDMHRALSALINSGKYSATTFNLAFYLSTLLKKEFEGEALEREKESKTNVAPYVESAEAPVAPHESASGQATATGKSKMPMAIAASLLLILLGGGAFFVLGSKRTSAAEPVKRVAIATPAPTPPPQKQVVIPEPILASPAVAATTMAAPPVDAAAQKRAFEDAVKEKLHAELMKLQSEYTKQMQQQQARNAPIAAPVTPVKTVADAQPQHLSEDRTIEPSAAQLDLQRQQEINKPAETVAQVPVQSTQASVPAQQPPAAVVPQIREGDVVDVASLDVVPKRIRDPRVMYPPMAARQRIETSVLASVLISESGEVTEIKVLRGDDRFGFTDAAVRALKTARYSTPMKDGKRVKTWMPQIIQFKP